MMIIIRIITFKNEQSKLCVYELETALVFKNVKRVHTSNSPFVYLASGTLTISSSANSGKPWRRKTSVFDVILDDENIVATADHFWVNGVKIQRGLNEHAENAGKLTLKCQRVRTATTTAVVVLPLPLEQLKTKAE